MKLLYLTVEGQTEQAFVQEVLKKHLAGIQRHLPDYDENVHGPLLAHDIGLKTIRDRCPHFDSWLTRLEQLDSGTTAAVS